MRNRHKIRTNVPIKLLEQEVSCTGIAGEVIPSGLSLSYNSLMGFRLDRNDWYVPKVSHSAHGTSSDQYFCRVLKDFPTNRWGVKWLWGNYDIPICNYVPLPPLRCT